MGKNENESSSSFEDCKHSCILDKYDCKYGWDYHDVECKGGDGDMVKKLCHEECVGMK